MLTFVVRVVKPEILRLSKKISHWFNLLAWGMPRTFYWTFVLTGAKNASLYDPSILKQYLKKKPMIDVKTTIL